MNSVNNPTAFVPSASEYILDNFEPTDRIAMLVLNRDFGETIQRITSAQKASSLEFQAWLRYKNANGSDIYIGQNPLRKDASTRTKEEIESIRMITEHVARAIMWYRGSDYEADAAGSSEAGTDALPARPHLRLVSDSED